MTRCVRRGRIARLGRGAVAAEGVMRPYVFRSRPKFCLAYRSAVIWVACQRCGHPHEEYFGPPDRDPRAAEIAFLKREYHRVVGIARARAKPAQMASH